MFYKGKIFENDILQNFDRRRIFLVNFMQLLYLIVRVIYIPVSQKMVILQRIVLF